MFQFVDADSVFQEDKAQPKPEWLKNLIRLSGAFAESLDIIRISDLFRKVSAPDVFKRTLVAAILSLFTSWHSAPAQ